MLIGIKSRIEPFRAWLLSWGSDTPPDTNPCALCGPSGAGKTHIVQNLTPGWGFDPEIHDGGNLDRLFTTARLPTLTGRRRLAVIDHAHLLSKAEWKTVEAEVKARQLPVLLVVEEPTQIPWSIRRGTVRIDIGLPRPVQVEKFLHWVRDERGLPHSDSDLATIASQSPTWRSAELTLMTTPPGMDPDHLLTPIGPVGSSSSEIEKILAGNHRGPTPHLHPISILSTAEFNGADPEAIGVGIRLHSQGWQTNDLNPNVTDYLTTLRPRTQDPLRYRDSPLRGGRRQI